MHIFVVDESKIGRLKGSQDGVVRDLFPPEIFSDLRFYSNLVNNINCIKIKGLQCGPNGKLWSVLK